jgi:hypothetical protein
VEAGGPRCDRPGPRWPRASVPPPPSLGVHVHTLNTDTGAGADVGTTEGAQFTLVMEKKELAWRAHDEAERNEFLLALLSVR